MAFVYSLQTAAEFADAIGKDVCIVLIFISHRVSF